MHAQRSSGCREAGSDLAALTSPLLLLVVVEAASPAAGWIETRSVEAASEKIGTPEPNGFDRDAEPSALEEEEEGNRERSEGKAENGGCVGDGVGGLRVVVLPPLPLLPPLLPLPLPVFEPEPPLEPESPEPVDGEVVLVDSHTTLGLKAMRFTATRQAALRV